MYKSYLTTNLPIWYFFHRNGTSILTTYHSDPVYAYNLGRGAENIHNNIFLCKTLRQDTFDGIFHRHLFSVIREVAEKKQTDKSYWQLIIGVASFDINNFTIQALTLNFASQRLKQNIFFLYTMCLCRHTKQRIKINTKYWING